MEESFYFALLRISMTQILKASGFDKCKPLVLNTVTELYIKYLELVLASAKKFSLSRAKCTNEMLPQDLVQALLDVQLIKPLSFESVLDPRDSTEEPTPEYSTKSLESFMRWLKYSDSFRLSKQLCEVPTALIHNLVEKRKIDISAETDQERKRRRLRERQEYYNQFKHGEEHAQEDRTVDDLDDDEITTNDRLSWLAYLSEKDLKLGHNLKFANTCILDTVLSVYKNKKFHPPSKNGEDSFEFLQNHILNYNRNDYVVLHIQEAEDDEAGTSVQPSNQLKETLPYNVKYSDALLNDNIEQYFKYAEEHPEEVEKIRESVDKAKEISTQNGKLPSLVGLSGEEKPVVSVLKEIADIDITPSTGDIEEMEDTDKVEETGEKETDKSEKDTEMEMNNETEKTEDKVESEVKGTSEEKDVAVTEEKKEEEVTEEKKEEEESEEKREEEEESEEKEESEKGMEIEETIEDKDDKAEDDKSEDDKMEADKPEVDKAEDDLVDDGGQGDAENE